MHLARDSRLRKHRAIKITESNNERGSQRGGRGGELFSRDCLVAASTRTARRGWKLITICGPFRRRPRHFRGAADARRPFTFGTALRINKNDNNDYCGRASAVVKSSASSALMLRLIARRGPPLLPSRGIPRADAQSRGFSFHDNVAPFTISPRRERLP